MKAVEIAVIVLAVMVMVQFVGLVMLAKLVADFLRRFRASGRQVTERKLKVGEMAPLFRERDQSGRYYELAANAGQTTLLFFASDSCGVCHEVAPGLEKLMRMPGLRIAVVFQATGSGSPLPIPEGVPLVAASEVIDSYMVTQFPTAVLVDANGMIVVNESINNPLHLRSLVEAQVRKAG